MLRPGVRDGRGADLRVARPAFVLLAATLATAACADEEPALRVGEVAFEQERLLGVGEDALETLATLAAFGQAVSDGRALSLVEPLARRDARAALHGRLNIDDAAAVDDERLRAAYRLRPSPLLTVRHLVVVSERWRSAEHRAGARREAEAALERVRAGEPLAEVAADVSDEPGAAERGGLLDPGREGTWVPEFWAAAAALEEGEVSGVVETQYGFHVLELEERGAVPFDEVRAAAEAEALREWERRVAGWAAALGFAAGQSPEEVAAASLEALGSTSQAARIARTEVAELREPLLDAYAVRGPEED